MMFLKKMLLLAGCWLYFFSFSDAQSVYTHDICTQATPVSADQHISFLFGIAGLDQYNCGTEIIQQNGVWYTYRGANKVVDILVGNEQSEKIDITVFSGNCDTLTCLSQQDLRFFGDSLTTYYILIAKNVYDYGMDPVAFTLVEKQPQSYDFCREAEILACDSTLPVIPQFLTSDDIHFFCGQQQSLGWFILEGDGQTKTIDMSAGFFNEILYSVYENSCDTLRCVYQGEGRQFRLATIPGKNYLVGISHKNLQLSIPIQVRLTCSDDNFNHVCHKSIPLLCSETLTATLSDTLAPDLVSDQMGDYPGLWYKAEGGSGQYRITISSPAIENLVIGMFKAPNGDCSSGLEPILFNPFPLPENIYVFNVLPGEEIYIKVAFFNQPVSFTISNDCKPFEDNIKCDFAKSLECGDSFDIYETAIGDFGNPKEGDEGNWFVLQGKDTPYLLAPESGSGSVFFDVYNDDCDSLVLIKSLEYFLTSQNGIFLDLPEGREYIIRTHFRNYNFSALEMKVICDANPGNVYCHEATEILCGDENFIDTRFLGVDTTEDSCQTSEGYWYTFEGDFSNVELIMNFPFQQFAVYEGNCDTLKCIYANEPFDGFKNFRFQTIGGIRYYIKFFGITPFSQRSFSIFCRASSDNVDCEQSDDLPCNDQLILDFKRVASSLGEDCNLENGFWYNLEGGNELIQIEGSKDVGIQVYENGCDSLIFKVTTQGFYTFYAEQGKMYFVRFFSSFSGQYPMQIRCRPEVKNDCDNTIDFTCPVSLEANFGNYLTLNEGDPGVSGWFGFWGEFTGDGSTYVIKNNFSGRSNQILIEIYNENCDTIEDSKVVLYDESWYFPTEPGVNYKVFCASPFAEISGSIDVNCEDKEDGMICDEASDILCEQAFIYNSANRSHDDKNEIYSQSWYTFEGDGSLANLMLLEPEGGFGYVFNVYESESSCDTLITIGQQTSNGKPLYWKTTSGKQYYIQIGMSNQTISAENWMFSLFCSPYNASENCETAKVVVCDSVYTTSALDTELTSFGGCAPQAPGTWYRLEGNDKVISLEVTEFYNHFEDIVVFVGEGQCGQIVCTDAFLLNRERSGAEFAAFEGKSYFIKLEGQRGLPFDLLDFEITCRNQAVNGSCNGAIPIVCGEDFTGKTGNLSSEGLQACEDDLPGLFYAVETYEGEYTLHFDLVESERFLVTIYQNSCDTSGVCLYKEEVNSQRQSITWQSISADTYFIRISGIDDQSDDFSAALTCDTIPLNTDCNQSVVLSCEDTVDISLVSPLGFEGKSPCFFTENARIFWYELPATNKVMSVDILKGKEQSHYISLLTGDCNNPDCLNVYDINSDFITFQKEGELPYYLAVHGDATSSNDFSFVLRCIDGVDNDECFDARPLACGDTTKAEVLFANHTPFAQDGCEINPWKDVWYEIEGRDGIFEFVFTEEQNFGGFVNVFLKGECNALTCLTNGPWRNNTAESVFRFAGEEGVNYLVSVQHPVGASTSFTLQCVPRAANDLCSGAFPVVFSDTLSVELTGSTGDVDISCYEGQKEGVWYAFEGDGGFVYFSNADTLANVVEYALLEGSCDTLVCLKTGMLQGNDSLTWKTEKDKIYYLVFYGNDGKIVASRGLLANNFSCNTASELLCNVPVAISSNEYIPDQGESLCSDPDKNTAWYVFIGSGEIRNFSFSSSGIDGSMEVLTECGGYCLYRHEISAQNPEPFSFLAVEDQKYYIKLNILRSESIHVMIMEDFCEEGYKNYSMATSLTLECGETEVEPQSGIINLLPDCYDNTFSTHWYTFTGNDSILTITDTFPEGITATIVNQNCEEIFQFTNDDLSFLTQKDSVYFMVLRYLSTDSQESFSFGVDYNCIIDHTDNFTSDMFTFKVMPNPFSDKVILELFSPDSGLSEIKLTDSRGQNIWSVQQQINSGKQWLPLAEWQQIPSGVYLLTLTTAKTSATIRLVKL